MLFYPLFLTVRSWSAFSCKLHSLLLLLLLLLLLVVVVVVLLQQGEDDCAISNNISLNGNA